MITCRFEQEIYCKTKLRKFKSMDLLLLELEELGFQNLADWIHNGEIRDLQAALKHLEENKHMMNDEEDMKAFDRAESIVRNIFKQ